MSTYFAFIDESGSYRKVRTERFNESNPYYVKSCFMLKDTSWKEFSCFKRDLCKKYHFSLLAELKWNHLWKLLKRDVKGVRISYKKNETFLKNITFEELKNFLVEFTENLPVFKPIILFTITPNCVFFDRVKKVKLEQMHFQDMTQRIEMEMEQRDDNNLAIIFADKLQEESESEVKSKYHEIFQFGDLIEKYHNIMDSINFQCSHQCCGIQMADFLAGILVGFLKGYSFSKDVFVQNILKSIRKGVNNESIGYGVIDVPKRPRSRAHLEEKFKEIIPF